MQNLDNVLKYLIGSEIMKKITMFILGLFMVLTPVTVCADTQAKNFEETFKEAKIEMSIDDYKETDDQITIYLFWWTGCGHCHNELEYLNEILGEYKDKIKLRAYEIQNSDNSELRKKVGDYFNVNGSGVPLLIVGENTFYGFPDEYKEKIKTAIDNEYSAEEKFDLFKALEEGKKSTAEEKKSNIGLYIFAGVMIAGILGFVIYITVKGNK